MNRLLVNVLRLENQNAKTNKYNYSQMVDRIKELIEEEVNAYKGH